MGRPTKYQASFAEQARKLCLLGFTDVQLAIFFEVDEATINRWKVDHPEFCKSIKESKEYADANVAASLYHRAIGYEHEDTDIRVISDKIVQTPIIKHYPPDTGAAMAWLKNRQKTLWRDKQDIDVNLTNGAEILSKLREAKKNARTEP